MNENGSPEANHIRTGREGEALALSYLHDRGFSLRARNFRFGRGELDLVMRAPDGDLVFVEVKASRGEQAGDPAGWVNGRKQLQVQRIAQGYCLEHGLGDEPMRFDVVAVEWDESGTPKVRHIPNAFLPNLRGYWRTMK